MKIVRCSWFPPFGFDSITLVWWIIIKPNVVIDNYILNHEKIHSIQQKEMLILPFFLWYCIEFLIRWIIQRQYPRKVYRRISFEQEAYKKECDLSYLKNRKPYSWFKYIVYK